MKEKKKHNLRELHGSAVSFSVASLDLNTSLLLVVPDALTASHMKREIEFFLGEIK